MPQIILASTSPRRKDLLKQMGVQFHAVASDFSEYLDHSRSAAEIAKELGLGKARAVAEQYPDAVIIGGDTIVALHGKQLGKATDTAEARAWLREQAGQDVRLTSSVAIVCKKLELEIAEADEAVVHFKPYNAAAAEQYLQSGDWADKAGGWGIQNGAAPLMAYIHGRYDTILGLPTHLLAALLQKQGVAARSLELNPPVPQK